MYEVAYIFILVENFEQILLKNVLCWTFSFLCRSVTRYVYTQLCAVSTTLAPRHVNNREHFFFTLPCNHQQPSPVLFFLGSSSLPLSRQQTSPLLFHWTPVFPLLSPLPHTTNNINSRRRYKIKFKAVAQICPNSDLNRTIRFFFAVFMPVFIIFRFWPIRL